MTPTLTLPWPARALHPNARPHFHDRAKAAKAAREQAHWMTLAAEFPALGDGEIMLDVRFHPPSERGDTDGMFAACKSYFDGIADGLGVNDRRFAFTIRRREVAKHGAVLIDVKPRGPP